MARASSLDLRERVVAAGQSCRSAAKTFMVSVASVVKWPQRQRAVGTPMALKWAATGLILWRTRAARSAPPSARPKPSSCSCPAYSPDLKPIKQAFTKMKTLLRKADARTIEQTWRTIGALLGCFTQTERAN
jgi:hypothetical protein